MGTVLCKEHLPMIILHGLQGAGKTSLLYRMARGEMIKTVPTILMFDVIETLEINGVFITCLDMGGRTAARPQIRYHYPNTQGFVYVIDSSDRNRLDEALDELIQSVMLVDETKGSVVLILANKQDLESAVKAEEVEERLEEKYIFSQNSSMGHTVLVRPCSVVSNTGMFEAFAEFTEQLRLKKVGKAQKGILPYTAHLEDQTTNKNINESVAIWKVKTFLRNPVSYLVSMFY